MKRVYALALAATLVPAGLAATVNANADHSSWSHESQTRIGGFRLSAVQNANPRNGVQNNRYSDGLAMQSVAWGSLPLTNPDAAAGVTHYGFNTSNITADGALTQGPKEAFKTEPDKNVYLTLGGHHYLFQGHEMGPRGYVTRIDLDEKDPLKRVSLVTDVDANGKAFPTIDGITWNPFTKQLLVTSEGAGLGGGVWGITLDDKGEATSKAVALPALGQGGYEGIQNDADGNVWIVEDTGGKSVDGGKVPNSYVYRFVPTNKADLTKGGTLQAMQIARKNGKAVSAAELAANPSDSFVADLHTLGTSFDMKWVDVHKGTTDIFNSTETAAKVGATPMKRPENGVFRPGTNFREFYFSETGDTTTTSKLPGAYGGIFKISMKSASAAKGTLSLAIPADAAHTGFDNVQWASDNTLLVVEDAGDGLHEQRNALDSGYAYTFEGRHGDEHRDHRGAKAPQPVRFLAEGRDASATFDSLQGPKYNDGDNEITGIHVSDGDASVKGILGAKVPTPGCNGWRAFWTQQHGDNTTWEIVAGH